MHLMMVLKATPTVALTTNRISAEANMETSRKYVSSTPTVTSEALYRK